MTKTIAQFPHRKGSDGLYDSICPMCFATVARSTPETEMTELEKTHLCDSGRLAERGSFARPSPVRSGPAQSASERSL
jgi:hypothetical protein